jgi:hypothetical protein
MVPPVLSTPDALEARRGEDVAFPIALDGTDGVLPGSVIVIRGLPQSSSLSSGQPQSNTVWSLKPDEIGDLHLALPNAWSGEANITIQLLTRNSGILAEAATVLKITADATASIADATESNLTEEQVAPDQEPEAIDVEKRANVDSAAFMSDLPPLPTRRPDPSGGDAGGANWIRPSAYVNLRDSPSSSAPVVGVVPKGAKLRATGRKRGWVQVTDPATTKSGWIYSGHVDPVR